MNGATAYIGKIRPRTERIANLDSLSSDEYRIVQMPCGHQFNLALVSFWKRILLTQETSAGNRIKFLQGITEAIFGPVNAEAVAAIEPCCDVGEQMILEICSLDVDKQTKAFMEGDLFRLLAKLNPSLLTALRLCAAPDSPSSN